MGKDSVINMFVNREEYLEQLKTLVNIESGSYDPEGINRVADQLETWYRDLGWHIQRHHLDDRTGDLLEISNRPASHYDVMFVGHMDTVFPRGTLAHWPFSTDGVNAYGPGVGDMKNGDVAMYQVATHLSKRALEKLNICMAYNPDEEIGSIYSKEKLDAIGRKSDFVYVMEGAGPAASTASPGRGPCAMCSGSTGRRPTRASCSRRRTPPPCWRWPTTSSG